MDYGGALDAMVTSVIFRRSPIPQGGLEIPIDLKIKQNQAPKPIFEKMKSFIAKYYLQPNDIPSEKKQQR